jgi:hypothetical protein
MRFIAKTKRSTIVIIIIITGIFLLTRCINDPGNKTKESNNDGNNERFGEFAGSATCARCHKDIYDKNIHTEHYLTSAAATEQNIIGSFEDGKNIFAFDLLTKVRMEKRDSNFFQVQYTNGVEYKRGRFDIVVGSGRKGQSYLNWLKDRVVQLPITYFSPAGQWSNSPGYPPDKVVFYRPITSRCLECHSTYFKKTSDPSIKLEEFDHNKIIYGVDCEKCHGPAAMHVEFQTKNPLIKEAKFIVNPGKLPRERILDLCALCHGGQLTKTKPSFEFQAGDTLSNYFLHNNASPDAANIDVHGNQLGLLSLSKCFIMSNMTCINCHNTHENENGKTELFSQRCMSCHSEGHEKTCKMTAVIGKTITQNCIDCHMPKQPSHAVSVYLEGSFTPTSALMRTHYIKIYPEETSKVLDLIKKSKLSKKTVSQQRNSTEKE